MLELWAIPRRQASTPSDYATQPTDQTDTFTGTETSPNAWDNFVGGTYDTGGGLADVLVMKWDPDDL